MKKSKLVYGSLLASAFALGLTSCSGRQTLLFLNWGEYIDEEMLDAFEDKYNCTECIEDNKIYYHKDSNINTCKYKFYGFNLGKQIFFYFYLHNYKNIKILFFYYSYHKSFYNKYFLYLYLTKSSQNTTNYLLLFHHIVNIQVSHIYNF